MERSSLKLKIWRQWSRVCIASTVRTRSHCSAYLHQRHFVWFSCNYDSRTSSTRRRPAISQFREHYEFMRVPVHFIAPCVCVCFVTTIDGEWWVSFLIFRLPHAKSYIAAPPIGRQKYELWSGFICCFFLSFLLVRGSFLMYEGTIWVIAIKTTSSASKKKNKKQNENITKQTKKNKS